MSEQTIEKFRLWMYHGAWWCFMLCVISLLVNMAFPVVGIWVPTTLILISALCAVNCLILNAMKGAAENEEDFVNEIHDILDKATKKQEKPKPVGFWSKIVRKLKVWV